MTRLPEGAVGNDLLSGQAAAAAKKKEKSARWNAWIERETYLTPTASPLLPFFSLHSLPPLHCHYDTRDCTHLRLADSELGTSRANVLFHSSHSHLLSPSLSPSLIAIYFLCFPSVPLPSVSLFLSHLLLRLETSNRTFGQPLSSWQVLK